MTPDQIAQRLKQHFGDQILEFKGDAIDPFVRVAPENVLAVCTFLHQQPDLYFDMCHNLSGYDLGPGKPLVVIYHLFSFRHRHWFTVKTEVPREGGHVPTVSYLWRTADWHEREVHDLFGISFDNHPDLRRILCPDDWQGWPLRKDYVVQEYYHGIRVPYGEDWNSFDTFANNFDRGHFVFAFEKRLSAHDGQPSGKKE